MTQIKTYKKIFLALVILLFVNTFSLFAQNIKLPEQPNPPRLVVDMANILSPSEALQLETKLLTVNDSTSNQISIVTVQTIDGNEIAQYANALYRKWGIGTKKNNNGVLILVAVDDHKMRIEPGYGLEGALPDLLCAEIIRNDMSPNFKRGDYFTGLDQATTDIISATNGEYHADPQNTDTANGGVPVSFIVMALIFIVLFLVLKYSQRNKKYYMSRNGAAGWDNNSGTTGFIIGNILSSLGNSGGGDWGGGGDSGGGFGGFGGGSSGGGGASGSW